LLLLSQWGSLFDDTSINTCHYDNFHISRIVQIVVRKQPEQLGEKMQVEQVCRMFPMLYKKAQGK